MSTQAPWIEETRPCGDPGCQGQGEPEEDGDLHYYACTTCGYEYGWEFQKQTTPGCQLGVPEDIRRRAQPPQKQGPISVTIGRRPPQ
jgi:hypothetical protein